MPKNEQFEKPDQWPKEAGRYRFYKNEKATKENPDLLSGNEAREIMDYVLNYKCVPFEIAEKDMQTPEFREEIEKRKEWISEFGKKIGLPNLKNAIDSAKLYLISEEDYEKLNDEESCSIIDCNEITTKNKDNEESLEDSQHEFIHSACKNNFFIAKKDGNYTKRSIFWGYVNEDNKKFFLFDEGITETTSQQIHLEHGISTLNIGYFSTVIFVAELVKDITKKIKEKANKVRNNGTEKKIEKFIKSMPAKLNGEEREITKEELESLANNLTTEEVLAHFQRGMFLGKRKYLKIIKDIYGGEALNALAKMRDSEYGIVETAKIFDLSLGNIVGNKIKSCQTEKETKIDIDKHELPLN